MDFPFEQDIILENKRVLLRPFKQEDKENLLAVATADEKLVQYSPSQIHNKELLSKYIDTAINDRKNKVRYAFAIYDKQASAYAGSSSYCNIFNVDKRLEIGYTWFGKQFQRTGLNRNCKFLMISYVFETLQFERLELRTDERNVQSRTAIEAIGGKFEGILRSHMLMPDGFRRSTVTYSILRSEWPEVKKRFQNL